MTIEERLEILEEKVVCLSQENVRLLERLQRIELHTQPIGPSPRPFFLADVPRLSEEELQQIKERLGKLERERAARLPKGPGPASPHSRFFISTEE